METVLRLHPLPCASNTIITEKHRSLIKLLRRKKSAKQLETELNASPEEVVDLFITAITMGLPITQENLQEAYGCDESYFGFIKENIGPDDTPDNIAHVQQQCTSDANATAAMIRMVVAFLRVREHLHALNKPFYDPNVNKLINAHLLFDQAGGSSQNNSAATPATVSVASCFKDSTSSAFDDYDDTYDDALGAICDQVSTQKASTVSTKAPSQTIQSFQAVKPAQIAVRKENIAVAPAASATNVVTNAAPVTSSNSSNGSAITKRVNIVAKSKVVYCNNSDSDDDDDKKDPATERTLPGWMSKATITSKPSVAKKKRIF